MRLCKMKKHSLSKQQILDMIDPDIFSTGEKLTNLIKLSQTECGAVPNSGEPFKLNSSGSSLNVPAENGDGFKNDTDATMRNMLPVTISCVMLMASNFDAEISEKSLTWAERYLECIKNEDGHHPPNVQGILNHILLLKSKKNSESDVSVNQKPSKGEMKCQSKPILECSPENCNATSSFLYP